MDAAAQLDAGAQTVAEAREAYFRENGFSVEGYTARWVTLKAGPFKLGFPNSEARRAAVPLHDLHHVATGYATSWTGEAEIAAWELAAGCGRFYAAWVLNLGAVTVGLGIAPRRVWRAFLRGRHSRSLYDRAYSDELLALTVGELRVRLGLDAPAPAATGADRLAFLGLFAACTAMKLALLAPVALAAWWLLA